MRTDPRLHRRGCHTLKIMAVACVAALVAACSGTSGTTSSTAKGNVPDTLTISINQENFSLDPAKAGMGPTNVFMSLAYDSLVRHAPNGDYLPALATAWEYTDKENKEFSITLREGVKFANGEDMTAEAVVASLSHVKQTPGGSASGILSQVESIKAKDAKTVVITTSVPNPDLPILLSDDFMVGAIIAPAGLADPEKLGSQTFGAGQYTLNAGDTVAGSHYTYEANPTYWDKDAVNYKKIIIRVITDPAAALQAVRAGQVDFAFGDPTTVERAKSQGLTVASEIGAWNGILLIDHEGTKVKALGDVRVRQALNFAVDRAAITKAVYGDQATPQVQPNTVGFDAYDESLESVYSYDPQKAKSLLAEAGYTDGFSFTLLVSANSQANVRLAQAVAGNLEAVGVKMEIKSAPTFPGFLKELFSKANPAAGILVASGPGFTVAQVLGPTANFNVFKTNDASLNAIHDKIRSSQSADERASLWKGYMRYLVENAWTLPISGVAKPYYSNDKVSNVEVGVGSYIDVRLFKPAG